MKNKISQNLIISLLTNRQELTIDEAAEYYSIPASTVSGIFYRLEKKGIIVKNSTKNIGKGRPAHCYRLRLPGKVAVCKFDGTEIVGAILDRNFEILSLDKVLIKNIYTLNEAEEIIRKLVKKLQNSAKLKKKEIDGLGVSVNAVQIGNRVFMSSVLPWANETICERLSSASGLTVKLITLPVVLAEYQKVKDIRPNTLVRYIVGDGVSGHSIVNGQLLKGINGLGGELGHIIADVNGELCGCGRKGCLEALCSGLAIRNGIIRDLKTGITSSLNYEILELNTPREAMKYIYQMWQVGDTFVRAYMDRIFSWLGWGLGLIVNILDPDIVRFGGYVLKERREWIQEIVSKSEQWILHAQTREIALEESLVTLEDELRTIATGFYY